MLGIDGSGSNDDSSSDSQSSDDDGAPANIGSFHLGLHLLESSCGEGALGLSDSWSFDVKLSHDGTTATWSSGGATVQGDFDEDARTLDFASGVNIDMRADDAPGTKPACTIQRQDRAIFTLDSLSSPKALNGDLTYTFTPASNSNCADLVFGSTPQFTDLPCEMHYKVSGAVK